MQLSFSDMKIKKKVVCKYELHGKRKRSQWVNCGALLKGLSWTWLCFWPIFLFSFQVQSKHLLEHLPDRWLWQSTPAQLTYT